ncbi:PQQ-binding-like beta-propeller repeat protein [Streptomyces sp. NPDC007325]|uniref:outer membrane protein assembly factor BamB family protein n=1 Tax=Streptomyces sp. NPDC007325 TaxID=3154588 RepID=UPI0033DA66B8
MTATGTKTGGGAGGAKSGRGTTGGTKSGRGATGGAKSGRGTGGATRGSATGGTTRGSAGGGTTRTTGSRLVRCTVVGGVVLALLAGVGAITAGVLSGEGYLPGDSLREVWTTERETVGSDSGNGAWAAGDTVVSSRSDGVTGFDARSGARRWRYAPAAGEAICSVSRTAEDGVALIAQGARGVPGAEPAGAREGCATVVALDLADGRALWRAARTPDDGEIRDEKDVVAVGGGLAVVRDEYAYWGQGWADGQPGFVRPDRAVRALDLRTGKPRWSAAVPKGCFPHGVAAGKRQVLALVVCGGDDVRLAAFDPADGTHRWTTELDERRAVERVTHMPVLLSAEPAVVSVDGLDMSGYPTVLSFGDDGSRQGRIAPGTDGVGRVSTAAPAQAQIAYGRLYAIEAYDHETITAFDLRSGRRLWHADLGDLEDVLGLRVADGRVTALVDLYASRGEDGLLVLDADTGEERDMRTFPDSVAASRDEIRDLFAYEGRLIPARTGGYRPFTAYEER